MASSPALHQNRLGSESSPYLKQHQHNPVDWYPWGEEALSRARSEGKPILLSVGYSSCHWCHVMAHESFESEAVAEALNRDFISIKVDREERPDLDQVYQNVAQAMTGGGGWPLTVFLLPDLRPFFGGTYFPPEDRYGRPGFLRLVNALAEAYRKDRDTVEENARKLTDLIHQLESTGRGREGITRSIGSGAESAELAKAAQALLQGVDWTHGGIGTAPKFPNTGIFTYLWRYSLGLAEDSELRERCQTAVLHTLKRMAQGGIFDQLGGGFSRYSVDQEWAVPHFEKMLYDNALLLQLYTEVLSANRLMGGRLLPPEVRELFQDTVAKTLEYLLREMKVPGGAFYAAQDADSEGEEGKFFVWKPEELKALLKEDEAEAFSLRYGVDEQGNFEHGTTVLHQARNVSEVSSLLGKSESDTRALIQSASGKLFLEREKRVKPGLDDKTLTSWSSLLITAFASTAADLSASEEGGRPGAKALTSRVGAAAEEAFEHLRSKCLSLKDGKAAALKATVQKGEGRFDGYLDDYAFFARAALDLSRVRPERAKELQELSYQLVSEVIDGFRDDRESGYYFVSESHERLLTRPKSVYDQAVPSGTAVILALIQVHLEIQEDPARIARLSEELKFQMEGLYPSSVENPFGHGELLCSFLASVRGTVFVQASEEALLPILSQPEVYPKAGAGSSGDGERILWCARGTCQEVKEDLGTQYWKFLGG